jgi:5'-methylthioadenosine phosphorylase
VPYRSHARALCDVGCGALVVTSSVGVLSVDLRLSQPMLVSDLVVFDNRLPDGTACTVFDSPRPGQGCLVLEEGLISPALALQLRSLAAGVGAPLPEREAVFLYRGGRRTRTRAENRVLAGLGADVNSMGLAPEVVLTNELGIPCAGLVVGHKASQPRIDTPDQAGLSASLAAGGQALEQVLQAFLPDGEPGALGQPPLPLRHGPSAGGVRRPA